MQSLIPGGRLGRIAVGLSGDRTVTGQLDYSPGGQAHARELAVGFTSFMVGSRVSGFAGGAAVICAFLAATGRSRVVAVLLAIAVDALPYAAGFGVLLSVFDRRRVVTREAEYAALEAARRPASRAIWPMSSAREYTRVASHYQWRLWLDWLVPAAAGAAFLLPAGMAGGLLIWATLYGTEALLWFLVWRPSLLRNVTSSAHEEASQ